MSNTIPMTSRYLRQRRLFLNAFNCARLYSNGRRLAEEQSKPSRTLYWIAGTITISGLIGYFYPPYKAFKFFTEHELPSPGSPFAENYSQRIEKKLQSLPIIRELRDKKLIESRLWEHVFFKDRKIHEVFTAGALARPGALSTSPIVFTDPQDNSSVTIVHCGRLVTGFPLIVHGGILGTLLDEAMIRTAFEAMDTSSAHVVSLDLTYRAPTLSNQFLVLRTNVVQSDPLLTDVEGTVETIDGKLLVQAKGRIVAN